MQIGVDFASRCLNFYFFLARHLWAHVRAWRTIFFEHWSKIGESTGKDFEERESTVFE